MGNSGSNKENARAGPSHIFREGGGGIVYTPYNIQMIKLEILYVKLTKCPANRNVLRRWVQLVDGFL